jgi:large subunit ribosomal protein L21
MPYAVVQTGGKQYRVEKGSRVRVEKLPGAVGDEIDLGEVLMIGGETLRVGTPTVPGAGVRAKIVAQDRDAKIIVFKIRRRKNYRRKKGHRQAYTELEVTGIVTGKG